VTTTEVVVGLALFLATHVLERTEFNREPSSGARWTGAP